MVRVTNITAAEPVMSPHKSPIRNDTPPRLNHHAGVVTMADVPHFMGDDAGKFVSALGLLQQTVQQINFAAGQSEGIGHR
jgi:hypothetical protein